MNPQAEADAGVMPLWLARCGWMMLGLEALGAATMPVFNIHNSSPVLLLPLVGAVLAAWLSLPFVAAFGVMVIRGRGNGEAPSKAEIAQACLLTATGLAFMLAG